MSRAVLERAFQTAESAGWSTLSLQRVLAGLQLVLDSRPDADPIPVSELRVLLGVTRGVRLARVAQVLDDLGLLVDDGVPTMRSWIEDRCQALPAGFRTEVRAWLLVLLDGDARARPRSASTIYGYFGRARPHLLDRSMPDPAVAAARHSAESPPRGTRSQRSKGRTAQLLPTVDCSWHARGT